MRALCISASPRENGNTSRILNEIARGLKDNGYGVKHLILADLDIRYCHGDKSCFKSGACVHHDDVPQVVGEMFDSQLVIIASPSYWGDVTAQMKTFIDRCTPYCDGSPARKISAKDTKGIAVAIRAGRNRKENENIVNTIGHFLGHLDIPLISSFTATGIDTKEDLDKRPEILLEAYEFGKNIVL